MSNNNRHEIFEKSVPMLVVGIILLSLVPMIIGVVRSRMGRTPSKAKA